MKFMLLMMNASERDWDIAGWSIDALKAHTRFMLDFNRQLTADGELVEARGLAAPAQAKIVRADASGAAAVTDGPFAEAKEFLAGYWIVDVETPERAIAIAALASGAPGPAGVPLNLAIQVREVMSGPPVDV